MDVGLLVKEANISMGSDYCTDVCEARCCKSGMIWFKPKHADLVTQGQSHLIEHTSGEYCWLRIEPDGCPSLDADRKCMIYYEEGRPPPCDDWPLKLAHQDGQTYLIVSICKAVEEGLLEAAIEEIGEHVDKIIRDTPVPTE